MSSVYTLLIPLIGILQNWCHSCKHQHKKGEKERERTHPQNTHTHTHTDTHTQTHTHTHTQNHMLFKPVYTLQPFRSVCHRLQNFVFVEHFVFSSPLPVPKP